MSSFAKSSSRRVLILDGGLGTTLEDEFRQDISHALWSAKPIDENPEVIIAAHLAFLRAGANIILTSTYQCAYNTFERAGYSREDAKRIMLKSVSLAKEAKRRFLEENAQPLNGGVAPDVRIALSLGPFGATLSPAQEFDGFYPPPFGPELPTTGEKTNAFADTQEGRAQEAVAIDALADFHYERLRVFAGDEETWAAVDLVAFETVPLRREVYAIRRAVARFQGAQDIGGAGVGGTSKMKPWWISTDYPEGRCPEAKAGGGHFSASEVAGAVLQDERGAFVWGFGINCTGLEFLPDIVEEARSIATKYRDRHGKRPWLVLYPNRGDVYEPETQTWRKGRQQGLQWAEAVGAIVSESIRNGSWEGVIAGGCCKTGPGEIARLAEALRTPTL
ncbi:Homocysteine S-methyltransferase [Trametes maxima]|nr:Homocysteine S-methyltransferase [Trametes maxima]